MSKIEVLAITGLDDAILGSAVVNGQEVLAYDFDKAIGIILAVGHTEEYAHDYLSELADQKAEGAPVFVYIDNDDEFYGSTASDGTTIH
jgi:hypothetical protein|tara:strand:+ start:1073 stop:1339 length:267 start_codon:yes stop_codon:yes gene_type:complete